MSVVSDEIPSFCGIFEGGGVGQEVGLLFIERCRVGETFCPLGEFFKQGNCSVVV
ncbi:hypothetical protein [Bartonella tribocorum]|uniref:hypothetical protein n=1 Tax=Bartonella tribocorum TaxID=85701 RepID=UPI000A7F250F|nr:hypothetical protein [Bartonella tribocorum]